MLLASSIVNIIEFVPRVVLEIPLVPNFPEKGAKIFFVVNLAIMSPFFTSNPDFTGSISSLLLILNDLVLLLKAVQ